MSKINKTIFILIIILAAFFRLFELNRFPPSLNWDEISHGYNAFSLMSTGMDQWGAKWPIFNFRAYGDYPTTANMYFSMPFVKFLGLNEWSVRLPSAIFGILFVILSYFFGFLITKNQKNSLVLMFLVAISPWTFFPSRAVFQSTIAQTLFFLGIVFFLYSIKDKPKLLPFSLISFGLSMYAYHNTRIVVPILLLVIFIIFRSNLIKIYIKHKFVVLFSIVIFMVLAVPSILNLLQPESRARSNWVSIINPASISIIEEKRNNFQGNQIINHLINNKISYFIPRFIGNYLEFLNPTTLFFKGTTNYQFNIPNTGILLSIWLPFFYLGILTLILSIIKNSPVKGRSPQDRGVLSFILFWFVLGLIPATITMGDFPIIRATTILPLPHLFIVLGLNQTLNFFQQKRFKQLIISLFIFLSLVQFYFYWQNYTKGYTKNYSSSWQFGYKEMVNFIKNHYSEYDQILITKKYGEPHEFVLFYWPWNPAEYQNDSKKVWDFHSDWYWVDAFDKFKFINDWEIKNKTNKNIPQKTLLITSPDNYNKGNSKLIKTINFLNNQPAFDIVQIL